MTSLVEIYAKDPLEYSRQDLTTVVAALREQRKNFIAGTKSAGKAPKAALTEEAKALDLGEFL